MTGNNETGNQVTTSDTGNQVTTNRPKSDNPYEFTEEDKQLYGDFNMDTPQARAWSRARRADYKLGSPVGEPVDVVAQEGWLRQDYQNCVSYFNTNNRDNPNLMVQFYDARGLVIQESGL